MPRKELSSREDFIVEQFAAMKKFNTLASKVFELYYIDSNPAAELSPMEQQVLPPFYIDAMNPEYPGQYVFAGKSLLDYTERILYITPYMDEKGKYIGDISAWKGLLVNPTEFAMKTKGYRKTKLDPVTAVGDILDRGNGKPQAIVLRERGDRPELEYPIPFLQLPNRRVEGDQAYFDCLEQSIYRPFYHYLTDYLKGSINFEALDVRLLDDLKEYGAADILTGDGHMLSISREIMSQVSEKVQYFLGFAGMDGDKAHYIMKEIRPNEEGKPHAILYTLFSVLDV